MWKRITSGYKTNDCLITIGTGKIVNEEGVGLKSNHAYGVLEILEEAGIRLMLVKNPWGNFRWNGKWSTDDTINWTEDFKRKFHYNDLKVHDNGIFWIELESVARYFDFMDINWNPAVLIYRKSVFDMWKAADMVSDDVNLSKNPQYVLDFTSEQASESSLSWIIISKMHSNSVIDEDDGDEVSLINTTLVLGLYGVACL